MRHICLYIGVQIFIAYGCAGGSTRGSTRGPRGPKKDFTEEKVHSVIVIMFSPNIQWWKFSWLFREYFPIGLPQLSSSMEEKHSWSSEVFSVYDLSFNNFLKKFIFIWKRSVYDSSPNDLLKTNHSKSSYRSCLKFKGVTASFVSRIGKREDILMWNMF